MSRTFDELGIPFPLFAVPVDQASVAPWHLCSKEGHGFRIGGDLLSRCLDCDAETSIHVAGDESPSTGCRRPLANPVVLA